MPLKPLAEADLALILPWRNSEAVRRAMYSHHEISMAEHLAWFGNLAKDPTRRWYLFVAETDTANGVVYFTDIDSRQNTAYWGFYARPGAQAGTGLRMGLDALDTAFITLRLQKLNGEVLSTNPVSINMFQRLGFREEGRFRDQHYTGSSRVDVVRFGMVRDEWQVAREQLVQRIVLLDEKAIKSQTANASGGGR